MTRASSLIRSATDSEVIKFARKGNLKLPEIAAHEIGLFTDKIRTSSGKFRRASNPVYPGLHEIITQPLYDSFTVAVSTAIPTLTVMFQNPIGQSSKTLLQTNMLAAGQLPAPQKFSVRAVRLAVRNDAYIADAIGFLWQSYINFTVSQKPYLQCPSALLTAGFGVYMPAISQVGATAPTGTLVSYSTVNGTPDQSNIFALSRPIQIEQNEQFAVSVNQGTAYTTAAASGVTLGTGLTIYLFLDGELSRAVN
jgi:hypothetical protein